MKNHFVSRVLAAVLAVSLVMVLAACGGGGKKSAEGEEAALLDVMDDGSVVATFNKTEKGTGGASGITIEDGEYLVIDTALTEGKVYVKVISGGTDMENAPVNDEDTMGTVDGVFEGSGSVDYLEIKPGDYMVKVEVEEAASGTITFSKKVSEDTPDAAGADQNTEAGTDTDPAADTAAAAVKKKASPTSPEMYFGSWVSGDYLLNIGESEDGIYANIYLQPVGETTEWLYNEVLFDEAADELNTPETGIKTRYVFDADGLIDSVVEDFEDGAAAFRLMEDGTLVWVDSKGAPGENEITFEKSAEPIADPVLLE